MPAKVNASLPCVTFFSAGLPASGLGNLFLQSTLVFWPLAVHWARRFDSARGVSRLLHEFADTYPVPLQRAKPGKRFRGAMFADQIVFGRLQGKLRRAV